MYSERTGGGGRAATTFHIDKFVKAPQNNMICVDLRESTCTEIPDMRMCTPLKKASKNKYKIHAGF